MVGEATGELMMEWAICPKSEQTRKVSRNERSFHP